MQTEEFKMKNSAKHPTRRRAGAGLRRWSVRGFGTAVILPFAVCLLPYLAQAYPPAPDGFVYGLVVDQYGVPLTDTSAQVLLQTAGGAQVAAAIQPNLAVGVNYLLQVPMDAGMTPIPYTTNALIAGTPYKLYVVENGVTNLPIEMATVTPLFGKPSQITLQNLTLGTCTVGDGIPDQWAELFLQQLGINLPLASINPNADYAHDGRTLLQEYLLGNYPSNPTNTFNVSLVSLNAGSAVLAFTTMSGRTYTASGSTDLQHWTALSFSVPAQGTNTMTSFYAGSIQPLQIQTVQPGGVPKMQFFRLQLQLQ